MKKCKLSILTLAFCLIIGLTIGTPFSLDWFNSQKIIEELPKETKVLPIGWSNYRDNGTEIPLVDLSVLNSNSYSIGLFSLFGIDYRNLFGTYLKVDPAKSNTEKVFLKSETTPWEFVLSQVTVNSKKLTLLSLVNPSLDSTSEQEPKAIAYFPVNFFKNPKILEEMSRTPAKYLYRIFEKYGKAWVEIMPPLAKCMQEFVVGFFDRKTGSEESFNKENLISSISIRIANPTNSNNKSNISQLSETNIALPTTTSVNKVTTNNPSSPLENNPILISASALNKTYNEPQAYQASYNTANNNPTSFPAGTTLNIIADEHLAYLAGGYFGIFANLLPTPKAQTGNFKQSVFKVVLQTELLFQDLQNAISQEPAIIGVTTPETPSTISATEYQNLPAQNEQNLLAMGLTPEVKSFLEQQIGGRKSTVALFSTGVASSQTSRLPIKSLSYTNLIAQFTGGNANLPEDSDGTGTALALLIAGFPNGMNGAIAGKDFPGFANKSTSLVPFRITNKNSDAEFLDESTIFNFIKSAVNHNAQPDIITFARYFSNYTCSPLIMHALSVAGQKSGNNYNGLLSIVSAGDMIFKDVNKNKIPGYLTFASLHGMPRLVRTAIPGCTGFLDTVLTVGALDKDKLWAYSNRADNDSIIYAPATGYSVRNPANNHNIVSSVEYGLAPVTAAASYLQQFFNQVNFTTSARDLKRALLKMATVVKTTNDYRFIPAKEVPVRVLDFAKLKENIIYVKSLLAQDPSGMEARNYLSIPNPEVGLGWKPDEAKEEIASLEVSSDKMLIKDPMALPLKVFARMLEGSYANVAPYAWCTKPSEIPNSEISIQPYLPILDIKQTAFKEEPLLVTNYCHYQSPTNEFFTGSTTHILDKQSNQKVLQDVEVSLSNTSVNNNVYQLPAFVSNIKVKVLATFQNQVTGQFSIEDVTKDSSITSSNGNNPLYIPLLKTFSTMYAKGNETGTINVSYSFKNITNTKNLNFVIQPRTPEKLIITSPLGSSVAKGQSVKLFAELRIPGINSNAIDTQPVRSYWTLSGQNMATQVFQGVSSITVNTQSLPVGDYTANATYNTSASGSPRTYQATFTFKVINSTQFIRLVSEKVVQAGLSLGFAVRVFPDANSNSYFVANPSLVNFSIKNEDGTPYTGSAMNVDSNGIVHTTTNVLSNNNSKTFILKAVYNNVETTLNFIVVVFNEYNGTTSRPIAITADYNCNSIFCLKNLGWGKSGIAENWKAIYADGRERLLSSDYLSFYSSNPNALYIHPTGTHVSSVREQACKTYDTSVHYDGVTLNTPVTVKAARILNKKLCSYGLGPNGNNEAHGCADESNPSAYTLKKVNKAYTPELFMFARFVLESPSNVPTPIPGNIPYNKQLPGTLVIKNSNNQVVYNSTTSYSGISLQDNNANFEHKINIASFPVGNYTAHFQTPHYKGDCNYGGVINYSSVPFEIIDNPINETVVEVILETPPPVVEHGKFTEFVYKIRRYGQTKFVDPEPQKDGKFSVELRNLNQNVMNIDYKIKAVIPQYSNHFRIIQWGPEFLGRKFYVTVTHDKTGIKSPQYLVNGSIGIKHYPEIPKSTVALPTLPTANMAVAHPSCAAPYINETSIFGAGTIENPLIVCKSNLPKLVEALTKLRINNPTKHYYLKQGENILFGGQQFDRPFGDLSYVTYNGDNRMIGGYVIYDAESIEGAALFKSIYQSVFKNVIFRNLLLRAQLSGALAISVNNSVLKNITVRDSTIKGRGASGIAWSVVSSIISSNAVFNSDITGDQAVGGLFGVGTGICLSDSIVKYSNLSTSNLPNQQTMRVGGIISAISTYGNLYTNQSTPQIIDPNSICQFPYQNGASENLEALETRMQIFQPAMLFNVHSISNSISSSYGNSYHSYVGGIIGTMEGGLLIDSSFTGNNANIVSQGKNVGLAVGSIEYGNLYLPNGIIKNTIVDGGIIAYGGAGGLVGNISTGAYIKNNTISGVFKSDQNGAGGAIGSAFRLRAFDNSVVASVRNAQSGNSARGTAGGFIGLIEKEYSNNTYLNVPRLEELNGNDWNITMSPELLDIGASYETGNYDDRGQDVAGIDAVH